MDFKGNSDFLFSSVLIYDSRIIIKRIVFISVVSSPYILEHWYTWLSVLRHRGCHESLPAPVSDKCFLEKRNSDNTISAKTHVSNCSRSNHVIHVTCLWIWATTNINRKNLFDLCRKMTNMEQWVSKFCLLRKGYHNRNRFVSIPVHSSSTMLVIFVSISGLRRKNTFAFTFGWRHFWNWLCTWLLLSFDTFIYLFLYFSCHWFLQ